MITFHNNKKIKTKYLNRLKACAKADELIQGVGWENGKGCVIGCTLESYDHSGFETELGIPECLARLEDDIFEHLKNSDAKKFAVEFLESIPVGVNLESVKWKFCAFVLNENIKRVVSLNIESKLKKKIIDSIQKVLNLHRNAIKTKKWNKPAAKSAAWSAADSADSAAWSSADSVAKSAAYIKYAKKLLQLLKNAK